MRIRIGFQSGESVDLLSADKAYYDKIVEFIQKEKKPHFHDDRVFFDIYSIEFMLFLGDLPEITASEQIEEAEIVPVKKTTKRKK